MSNININTNAFQRNVVDEVKNRLLAIGMAMVRDIKRSMRGYGQYSRLDTRQVVKGSIRQKGKRKKYHYPSPPGGVPAVDTGRLRASITMNWCGSGINRAPIESPSSESKTDDGVGMPSFAGGIFRVVVGTNVEYGCMDAATSVLTKKGWRRISFIKIGDEVLTQTGEYHKVLKTIKIPKIERPNMVTIKVRHRENFIRKITMTEDHKILIFREGKNKWVCAKDLLLTDKVFCTPKIANNKKYFETGICSECGKKIKSNLKFCSIKCSAIYRNREWVKNGTNPHIGMKRNKFTREKISKKAIERYINNPYSHPNIAMAKKGYITSIEKEIISWLKNRKLRRRYIYQYPIGNHYVDFYIPSLKCIYEADGGYWHNNQKRDIERDKSLLKIDSELSINHIHFFDKRHSPKNIISNPLPRVYYSICNPGMNSFVDLSTFKTFSIFSIDKWKYEIPIRADNRGNRPAYVYDLSIDGVHSYYANGILVSNSYLELGTSKMQARPYLRPILEKYREKIRRLTV